MKMFFDVKTSKEERLEKSLAEKIKDLENKIENLNKQIEKK
jgi:hypothetical protein